MTVLAADWRGAGALFEQGAPACTALSLGEPTATCDADRPVSPAATARIASWAATLARPSAALAEGDRRHVLALIDATAAPTDRAALNRALETVSAAARETTASAMALNDHAAIRLQRYATGGALSDLLMAIESAAHARELAADRWQPCWNHAVALTWAGLRSESARVWKECARITDGPRRAPVVRDAAPNGSPAAVARSGRSPETTRDVLWTEALPEWVTALLSRVPARTDSSLRVVEMLHAVVRASGLDPDADAVIADVRSAALRRDSAQLASMRAGLTAAALARSGEGRQSPESTERVVRAAAALPNGSAALQRHLTYEHANMLLIVGRTREADSLYRRVLAATDSTHRLLRVRAEWGLGWTAASSGNTAEGLRIATRTAERCAQLAMVPCELGARTMAAEYASLLGDAWDAERSLRLAIGARSRSPLATFHWSAADLLGRFAASLALFRAERAATADALSVAEALSRADLIALTRSALGTGAMERGDTTSALGQIRLVEALAANRLPAESRSWFRVKSLLVRGSVQVTSDPQRSAQLLDSALMLTANDDNEIRRTPIRAAHALSQLHLGDTVRALTEYDALMVTMTARARTDNNVFRSARLASVLANVSERSAAILRGRGESIRALDALSGRPFLHQSHPQCCASSTSQAVAVRVVGDSLWVWTPVGTSMSLAVHPLDHEVFSRARALDDSALAQMYRTVFGNGPRAVPALLCLDVRGEATAIPWNALIEPASGRRLIELSAIRRVPSALEPCVRTSPIPKSAQVTLVDAGSQDGPRGLPAVSAELQRIQQLWPASRRINAPSVTTATIGRAFSGAELLHFAGHAVINRERPERSYLLVRSTQDSALFASTLTAASMERTRLVILSACETSSGSRSALSGFDSFAGVLLDAGAGAVIGTEWPVEDAATAELMTMLHRALLAQRAPDDALRDAQLAALHSQSPALRSPRVWAAFQLMGSGGNTR
jgi:hypothetical protein